MNFLDSFSKDEINNLIKNSKNFPEVLLKMGRSSSSSSNRALLLQYVKDHNINIEHFDNQLMMREDKDIFTEDSHVAQSTVRKHYKKGNYSPYKCAICNMDPIWNDKPLVLTLDHINGKNNDHRLENLRWICPNCDSQLPTYGRRNNAKNIEQKQLYYCEHCGKELERKTKTGLCKDCYHMKRADNKKDDKKDYDRQRQYSENNRCIQCGEKIMNKSTYCRSCWKEARRSEGRKYLEETRGLTKEKLLDLILRNPIKQIANIYNVSDHTVRKWCKTFELPCKQEEIKKLKKQLGVTEWHTDNKGGNGKKSVAKYDKQNNLIMECPSIKDAAQDVLNETKRDTRLKTVEQAISLCCHHKQKTAYGYIWKFTKE